MQVSAISTARFGSKNYFQNNSVSIPNYSNQLNNDTFVKTNNVSFGGKVSDEQKNSYLSSVLTTGFVGASFILPIMAAAALAKGQDPEEIFLSDGTYVGNVHDMSFKSRTLNIDADDGVFTAKGTGIDIRPERFDIVDPAHGVYRNAEKGIDIDLVHHKYIDPENGIFIDPNHSVAAAVGHDGVLKNLTIPAFKGSSMNTGGGGPVYYGPDVYYRRTEFIDKFGMTPEEFVKTGHAHEHSLYMVLPNNRSIGIIPDENRSAFKKFIDSINPFSNGKILKYDTSKHYDIYGRELVFLEDKHEFVPVEGKLKELVDQYNITSSSKIGEIAEQLENAKLQSYISSHYGEYSHLVPHIGSVEDFIHHATQHHDYDLTEAHKTLEKISADGNYQPEHNSHEAINFKRFQDDMITSEQWSHPVIEPESLVDNAADIADAVTPSGDGSTFADHLQDMFNSFIHQQG